MGPYSFEKNKCVIDFTKTEKAMNKTFVAWTIWKLMILYILQYNKSVKET